ncbi:MAG: hypothetical protein ACTHLW_21055 [Verrucomicrobiota bacterium]
MSTNKRTKTAQPKKPKLTPFQKQVIEALEYLFTVDAWEIPDDAVVGKFATKIRELETRLNALDNRPAVQRIDPIVALGKKGGAK